MKIAEVPTRGLLRGQTAFIAGGGSGIKLGIARKFAALGANTAICSRNFAKLEGAAEELRTLGSKALPLSADVRDAATGVAELEWGHGIRANCIASGYFEDTEGTLRRAKGSVMTATPLTRLGTTGHIGQAAVMSLPPGRRPANCRRRHRDCRGPRQSTFGRNTWDRSLG